MFAGDTAKVRIRDEMVRLVVDKRKLEDAKKDTQTHNIQQPSTSTSACSTGARPKTDFWGSFKAKIKAGESEERSEGLNKEEIKQNMDFELKGYLYQSVIETNGNPFDWWKENQFKFPNLSQVAKSYLFIPATSVPSERMFSKAGAIVSDRRASLKADKAEMLVFLNHNLKAKYM